MRNRYDWNEVQRYYDEGHGRNACAERFGFSLIAWYKAIRRGRLRAELQRQRTIDWAAVQQFYDEGHTYRECKMRFQFAAESWAKALRRGALKTRPLKWPLEKVLAEAKCRPEYREAALARSWYTGKRLRGVRATGVARTADRNGARPPERRQRRQPAGKPPDALPKLPQSNRHTRSQEQEAKIERLPSRVMQR